MPDEIKRSNPGNGERRLQVPASILADYAPLFPARTIVASGDTDQTDHAGAAEKDRA